MAAPDERVEGESGGRARLRRPALDRDAPQRDWRVMAGGSGVRGAGVEGAEDRSPADAEVTRGVGAAYRVVEAYLQAGEQAARQFAGSWSAGPLFGVGSWGTGERADLESVGKALLTVFSAWAEVVAGMAADRPHAAVPATPPADPVPAPPEVALQSVAGGTATGAFVLPPGLVGAELVATDLLSPDQGALPLTGLTVFSHPAGVATLVVTVPSACRPGRYVGAVFAPSAGRVAATVTLAVDGAPAS